MNKFSLLLFLMVLSMMSCRDEVREEDPTTTPIGVTTNFEQNIFGQVLTSAGEPIAGATVTTKEETVMSDDNGYFLLSDTPAGNRGTQISAVKDGFLYGGYKLYANAVGQNHVDIVLLEARALGSIDAVNGGELSVAPNSSVTFPDNAFTLNGTDPYVGNVNVTGNWIDPRDENLLGLTPGDLGGINLENERVILSSFGMIGIELTSDSGEELQIIDGKEATLKFVVPPSLMSLAPATIPLWSFDEENGDWIEESVAELVGSQYVGQVSHFSWWNTDLPNAVLDFCITVIDEATGTPVANAWVYVYNLSGFGCATGYTDDRGVLCGLIPADSELQITVSNDMNNCPGATNSVTVGPYPANSPPIFVTVPVSFTGIMVSDISGTVTACNTGDPVENAIVQIIGNSVLTDADGYYTQTITTCEVLPTLDVNAIDLNSLKEGTTTLMDVDGGSYTANVNLCEDIDEFFELANIASTACEVKVRPFETHILPNDLSIVLGFEGAGVGTYEAIIDETPFNLSAPVGDVEITKWGQIGETITGIIWSDEPTPVEIGSFVAKRIQ